MESVAELPIVSRKMSVIGWIVSILPCLLLLMSAVMKFIKPPGFDEGMQQIGLDPSLAVPLGIVEIACTVIYLIPRTAVLGAVLLTAYMGGAVATHVRVGDPFFIQVLVGMVIWLGIYLREPRLRPLLPLRN